MQASSALVDLKAELCRKEHELNEARKTRSSGKEKGNKTFAKIQQKTGKKRKLQNHNDKCEGDGKEGNEVADETLILLEQARRKLEAKSKIYEKMQKGEMQDVENIYGETKFLVDFQHKYYTDIDDEDKWLDESFSNSKTDSDSLTPNNSKNSSLLFEVEELHREKMRDKWEKEQEEILNGPVHYENVRFDEIRDLGTGYFAFSKNEEERKKQMEDLQNLREQTKTAQNKKEILKNKRKAALQERLDKVRNRKFGNICTETEEKAFIECHESGNDLPGSSKHSPLPTTTCTHDHSIKCNNCKSEEAGGSEELEAEDEERLKLCRKGSQKERDWDKGKRFDGFTKQIFVKSKGGSLYEELVDKKRSERIEEFAPPDLY